MVSTRTRPGSREFANLTRTARTAATFIQVARAAHYLGDRLILEELEPTTIWLANDPEHHIGHMATGTFLDLWSHPESGLAVAGLRGVLGLADPDAQLLGDAVLRLRTPRICGSGLQYDAVLLGGSLPATAGACVLFLGPRDVAPASGGAERPATARSAPSQPTCRVPWRL